MPFIIPGGECKNPQLSPSAHNPVDRKKTHGDADVSVTAAEGLTDSGSLVSCTTEAGSFCFFVLAFFSWLGVFGEPLAFEVEDCAAFW